MEWGVTRPLFILLFQTGRVSDVQEVCWRGIVISWRADAPAMLHSSKGISRAQTGMPGVHFGVTKTPRLNFHDLVQENPTLNGAAPSNSRILPTTMFLCNRPGYAPVFLGVEIQNISQPRRVVSLVTSGEVQVPEVKLQEMQNSGSSP